MPIISVEMMKTIDEREMQKTKEKQRQRGARGTDTIVKGWELSDFVVHLS